MLPTTSCFNFLVPYEDVITTSSKVDTFSSNNISKFVFSPTGISMV